jgi:hypothetical protein
MIKRILGLLIGATLLCPLATAAEVSELSGPRIGVTGITPGQATDELGSYFIGQYGWQLETRFSNGEGFCGLAEFVFLVGGTEQGYFLPSISSLVGYRNTNGFEAAVGPNISITGIGFVLAMGYNFKSGSLNIPVNLSWVPSTNNPLFGSGPTGHRISITFGFNMDNKQ